MHLLDGVKEVLLVVGREARAGDALLLLQDVVPVEGGVELGGDELGVGGRLEEGGNEWMRLNI